MSGSNPVVGATIHVVDAAGVEHTLVTHDNGNFYTSDPMTFPVQVGASMCPDTVQMNGDVASGNCNACHGSGFRVHLP